MPFIYDVNPSRCGHRSGEQAQKSPSVDRGSDHPHSQVDLYENALSTVVTNSMLSPCSHGWLHTGCVTSHSSPSPVLAFSSHPSWHTQDDATLGSTSWPSQHMSCTSPRGPIYSAACSNMNRPQASRRDSGGNDGCRSRRATSILRGGSGSGEGDGGDNGEGSTRSQVQTSETVCDGV